jgi:hypothetical protein
MERTTFRRTIATRHLAEVIFMHCRSVCRSVRRFPIHSWGLIQPCVDLHHDTAPSLMIILSRVNFGEMKERSKKLIAIWNHCIEAVASPVLICWTPDYDAKQCKYRTFGAIWIVIYCTTTVILRWGMACSCKIKGKFLSACKKEKSAYTGVIYR